MPHDCWLHVLSQSILVTASAEDREALCAPFMNLLQPPIMNCVGVESLSTWAKLGKSPDLRKNGNLEMSSILHLGTGYNLFASSYEFAIEILPAGI